MTSEAPLIQVPPGLKGVAVTDTSIGDVRGREGFYHYRQYSAVDLAQHRSFEDVWYLFVEGHLPDDAQRRAFLGDVAPLRSVPSSVVPALAPIAGVGSQGPLDGLRSALSVLGAAHKMRPVLDIDAAERRLDALTLAAATPTLVQACTSSSAVVIPSIRGRIWARPPTCCG
jgi:citrate synthase